MLEIVEGLDRFASSERPWLLLEALRCLRLLLLVLSSARQGHAAGRGRAAWWLEDDLGRPGEEGVAFVRVLGRYQRHEVARRRLGETLVMALSLIQVGSKSCSWR